MGRIILSLKIKLKRRKNIKVHKPNYVEIRCSNVLGKNFGVYVYYRRECTPWEIPLTGLFGCPRPFARISAVTVGPARGGGARPTVWSSFGWTMNRKSSVI